MYTMSRNLNLNFFFYNMNSEFNIPIRKEYVFLI